MQVAALAASWSKDPSRKVGAVIVTQDEQEIARGWNGAPRGCGEVHERPRKYLRTEHAERNAFYNAARVGIPTRGARLYSTLYPCADCARGIIQCGIVEVVAPEPDWNDTAYADSFAESRGMFAEAGVRVKYV